MNKPAKSIAGFFSFAGSFHYATLLLELHALEVALFIVI